MPPERIAPGAPADWLRHANSDLALARSKRTPEILPEALCFHAQQSVEKALKAVLLSKNRVPPRTHNIRTLLDLLPDDMEVPEHVEDAAVLTEYAVMSRYPSVSEPVEEEELMEAVRLAGRVLLSPPIFAPVRARRRSRPDRTRSSPPPCSRAPRSTGWPPSSSVGSDPK